MANARADKGVKHKACQSVSLSVTEICVCGCVIPAKIRNVLYTCNQQSFLNESTLKVGESLRRAAKGISIEYRGEVRGGGRDLPADERRVISRKRKLG